MDLKESRKYIFPLLIAAIFVCALVLGFVNNSPFMVPVKEAIDNIFKSNRRYVAIVNVNQTIQHQIEDEARVVDISNTPSDAADTFSKQISISKGDLGVENVLYDTEGADEGTERIIIKNKTPRAIDLSRFSIQYLKPGSSFTSIFKKNFESGARIEGNSIFTIGANCTSSKPCMGVNMSWSQALGNESGSIFLVSNQERIINTSDPEILDTFTY